MRNKTVKKALQALANAPNEAIKSLILSADNEEREELLRLAKALNLKVNNKTTTATDGEKTPPK